MNNPVQPSWIPDAVFYQIFVERFANGRPEIDPEGVVPWGSTPTRGNFFGGDLPGIARHLDHLENLGVNALYLTPIFEADTNHRYDTADYSRIDHRLGDLADYQALLGQAHRRGIRVVLDAVFNHTGEGHWAFRHIRANGPHSPYADWYHMEFPVQRDPKPNYGTFAGCPYLPKLNHANPKVRDYLYGVALDWLRTGIDGWRLDVPYEMEPDFWRGFREVVKGENPQAYIVGEVWELATQWLQGDLFDGTMNYPLRSAILGFASAKLDAREFVKTMNAVSQATPAWARPGMLNLLGSHDTERVWTHLDGDPFALRVATALQFTCEGAPMVYYGDEIGLAGGDDPDNRRPMPWDKAVWDRGLLAWTRELIELRKAYPVLRGSEDALVPLSEEAFLRRRGNGDEAVYLVVNRGEIPVELPADLASARFAVLLGDGDAVQFGVGRATLGGHSLVVLGNAYTHPTSQC
ncbi:MAG: glycoside hydrolase family 13 protein [Propionibacteriaceae bacterium]|jgi:glycosidase|nr:glycoside hydrolase family 13 protein [Propionibacteriaceae bacterium]